MSTNSVKPLHLQIDELLQCTSIDPLRHCLFKLPCHFRKGSDDSDEKVYEPQVVSIGPFHHGKDHLKAMEMYKLHFLKMLLERREEKSVERYVVALKAKEKKALDSYAGSLDIDGEALVKMMLLDGCFIIELIQMGEIAEPFILRRVMRDLLLFENQLPFFILVDLFNMTVMPNDQNEGFIPMAVSFFSHFMPDFGSIADQFPDPENIKHLLELLHRSCFSLPENHHMTAQYLPAASTPAVAVSRNFMRILGRRREPKRWELIPSAELLLFAGIRFKQPERDHNRLSDIKFEEAGIMRIPTLVIDDDTESILRNLVSYEQGHNMSSKLVSDYITLMFCLIRTEKDVELLCRYGVVKNWLGNYEMVVNMFTRVRKLLVISEGGFFYAEMFIKVNIHRRTKWNLWKVDLRRNYFNTPWAMINLFFTIMVLVLTVMQTVK